MIQEEHGAITISKKGYLSNKLKLDSKNYNEQKRDGSFHQVKVKKLVPAKWDMHY